MRKPQQFFWGWKHYDPKPDPSMTRERAAKLMRAWRRAKTQGNPEFLLRRVGRGHYTIECTRFDDVATIIWL